MHRAVGEVELQTVGAFAREQRIRHVAERTGAEDSAHGIFYLRAANPVAGVDFSHFLQQQGIFHALSGELHGRDFNFCGGDVGGRILNRHHGTSCGAGGNHVEFGVVLEGGRITAAEYGVDGFGAEAHHVVAFEVRADAHVGLSYAFVICLAGKHVYHLGNDVPDIVYPDIGFVHLAEHNPYYDVRTHRAREVCWEVVAHSAVGQHHPLVAHGIEQAGDAHRGAHRHGNVASGPVLGLAGHEVRGDAEERYGKLGEGDGIAIAHREAGKGVLHVDTAHPPCRKTCPQATLGTVIRARYIGIDAMPAQPAVAYGDQQVELFPEHLVGIRNERRIDVVAQHQFPVETAEKRIQEIRPVAQRIQAAHQAAHTGAEYHVHRYPLFFQTAQHSHVRGPLGSASAEHYRHRGAPAGRTHGGHTLPHLLEDEGVPCRVEAGGHQAVAFLGVCAQGREEQDYYEKNAFHCSACFAGSACLPASMPQAASMSSPREALMVQVIPL